MPAESRFATLAGPAMAEPFAGAAARRPVTPDSIRAKLSSAEGKLCVLPLNDAVLRTLR